MPESPWSSRVRSYAHASASADSRSDHQLQYRSKWREIPFRALLLSPPLRLTARRHTAQFQRNRVRKLSEPLNDRENRGDITIWSEATDDRGGRTRCDGVAVQLIPRVDVGNMYLDLRAIEDLQRVYQGHRREGIGGRVHDDRVRVAVS